MTPEMRPSGRGFLRWCLGWWCVPEPETDFSTVQPWMCHSEKLLAQEDESSSHHLVMTPPALYLPLGEKLLQLEMYHLSHVKFNWGPLDESL